MDSFFTSRFFNFLVVFIFCVATLPSASAHQRQLPKAFDGSESIQYQLPADLAEWLWDTNSIPDGRYYLRAIVKDARGATTEVYSEAAVIISQPAPYDLNRDGVVDIVDLVLVANRFGETIVGQPDVNPDLNGDGAVDILDLVLCLPSFCSRLFSTAPMAPYKVTTISNLTKH
jgi:hypothetical protein